MTNRYTFQEYRNNISRVRSLFVFSSISKSKVYKGETMNTVMVVIFIFLDTDVSVK